MKEKASKDQKKKLIESLNVCKEQMKEAHENGRQDELREAKENYYRIISELDKIQSKSKN